MKGLCPYLTILRVARYRDGADYQVEPMIREKAYCKHPESRHRFRRTGSSPAVCNGDLEKCNLGKSLLTGR